MPFYKCGSKTCATMSSRITGLISICFIVLLSFPIGGFSIKYLGARNLSREKRTPEKVFSEKINEHSSTKSSQIIHPNDKNQQLLQSNDLASTLNLNTNMHNIRNITLKLSQNSATQSPAAKVKHPTKESKMPNIINLDNSSTENQLNLVNINTKPAFKRSNASFYKTDERAHDFKQSQAPLPLRKSIRKNKTYTDIQSNLQGSSIIPVYIQFSNSSNDVLKKYVDVHRTSYQNIKHSSSKKQFSTSSNPHILSTSPVLMEIKKMNKSKLPNEENAKDILEQNLQYFPSTLGYIFRTILQNERGTDKNVTKTKTEPITRSENFYNIPDNTKSALFGYVTKMQRTLQPDEDYDILENSAVKFILNRKVPSTKSSTKVSEAPLTIYTFSDTSTSNINEQYLGFSSEKFENNNRHRKSYTLSDALNNHKIVYNTTNKALPSLSTVSSVSNIPKFSQTFMGEDNTLDNSVFEKIHKTTENQLSKPIFRYEPKYRNGSQVDDINDDLQILAITEPTNNDSSSRKSKMSNSDKSYKMSTDYSQDTVDLKYAEGMNELSIPEFHPGTLVHFSETFHRRPVYETDDKLISSSSHPRGYQNEYNYFSKNRAITPKGNAFEQPNDEFNAIGSTFFPFRMEDVSMQFADKGSSITKTSIGKSIDTYTQKTNTKILDNNKYDEDDDDDYRDIRETSLTMETLAYFLIGTCCGLSILCLCIVVAAIKCRRSLVERRVRKQFRSKLFYPNRYPKLSAAAWQQQFLDQFIYHRADKQPNSSCSSRDTCNCKCVTWSLGVRNLDTQPICPTGNSVYLCGRKRLPFGAASTLQYESMLGRRRQMSPPRHLPPSPPKPESSNENDSLDEDSATEPIENTCPKQCTCIGPAAWRLHEGPSMYSVCPVARSNPIQQRTGNPRDRRRELRYITGDFPPPVSGLNYLDRAEGVVYWTSNEERLI